MSCPLYKRMKERGTSIYAFRSAANDLSLAFNNPTYKFRFSKFVLLNFPKQVSITDDSYPTYYDSSGIVITKNYNGVLDFHHSNHTTKAYPFQNFDPNGVPTKFSDQLVESLRNYVANYDTTTRESKLNQSTDFYNIKDLQTPTEFIFWKWARKLRLLDFEPALNKIDWDKSMPDFANPNKPNQTAYNYFPKYLWKERDVIYYPVGTTANSNIVQTAYNSGQYYGFKLDDNIAKFKAGDYIYLNNVENSPQLSANTAYKIVEITFNKNTNITEMIINQTWDTGADHDNESIESIYLKYERFVQYVGEIQSQSITQSSKRNVTEVTAQIPHHCGQTPNILFKTEDTNNYYPDLELPILPDEIQEYIVGAEYSNSPIRMKPQDYPGSAYGYYDTYDKTYKCSTGDKITYTGDYYGILSSSIYQPDGKIVTDPSFIETLDIFNSDNIDGVCIDYDYDHYLKMNLPNQHLSNFDEFNSVTMDGIPPNDFEFNAILWYYDLDDGTGNIKQNLYGIEFLNNPNDDFDDTDTTYTLISTYRKLVSNSNQDGLSYIFNLNISYDLDNGELPLTYDPTTIYNQMSFDLYQKVLQANAMMYERFGDIINAFGYYNEQLFQIKSLVYSQTDIDTIKSRMDNLENLLQTYSTFQFVDSDTAKIAVSYQGNYPSLQVNVVQNEYADIVTLRSSTIYEYNLKSSGLSYLIPFLYPNNRILVNIKNDDIVGYDGSATILLGRDLNYKQSIDILIEPYMTDKFHTMNVNMNFNYNNTYSEVNLITGAIMPRDLSYYDLVTPANSTYDKSYYQNQNIKEYFSIVTGNTTKLYLDAYKTPAFAKDQWVFIDNMVFLNTTGSTVDYSNIYKISAVTLTSTTYYYTLDINTSYLTLLGNPVISYFKGMNYNILRIDSSNTSTPNNRYKITKTLL